MDFYEKYISEWFRDFRSFIKSEDSFFPKNTPEDEKTKMEIGSLYSYVSKIESTIPKHEKECIYETLNTIHELYSQKDYKKAQFYIVSLQLLLGMDIKLKKTLGYMISSDKNISEYIDIKKFFNIEEVDLNNDINHYLDYYKGYREDLFIDVDKFIDSEKDYFLEGLSVEEKTQSEYMSLCACYHEANIDELIYLSEDREKIEEIFRIIEKSIDQKKFKIAQCYIVSLQLVLNLDVRLRETLSFMIAHNQNIYDLIQLDSLKNDGDIKGKGRSR